MGPLGVGGLDGAAAGVDAKDEGGGIEGAHHEGEATVFEEVRGGLVAAAGDVEVADARGGEDAEGVHALGREVDAAGVGSGGDEVDFLRGDEVAVGGGKGGDELGHGERGSFLPRAEDAEGAKERGEKGEGLGLGSKHTPALRATPLGGGIFGGGYGLGIRGPGCR